MCVFPDTCECEVCVCTVLRGESLLPAARLAL